MSVPVATGNLKAHTEIEVEDSCNCCWGRKIKKQPSVEIAYPKAPLHRSHGRSDIFSASTPKLLTSPRLVKDANEVFNFNVNVTIEESPTSATSSDTLSESNETKKSNE